MPAATFVRTPQDVQDLIDRLREIDAEHLGIILKIETVPAFENLPELLLTAMQSDRVGVMIARGDLAVEAGFERLAEVQEGPQRRQLTRRMRRDHQAQTSPVTV